MNKLLSFIFIGVHLNSRNDLLNPYSRSYAGINVRFRLLEFMSRVRFKDCDFSLIGYE